MKMFYTIVHSLRKNGEIETHFISQHFLQGSALAFCSPWEIYLNKIILVPILKYIYIYILVRA